MNIHDAIGYGPAVFSDEDTGVIITVNGSYLNWWMCDTDGELVNSDCRGIDSENGLYSLTVSDAIDQAKAWFEEVMNPPDSEE